MTAVGLDEEVHREVVGCDPLEWTSLSVAAQRERILASARGHAPLLGGADLVDLVERVHARVLGLGPLDPFLDLDGITEVMVNGDGRVWIEHDGRLQRTDVQLDEETVRNVIERIVAPLGRRIDRSSPVVDARLPNGSRVHAVVPPIAVDGPCVTIRRFAARAVPLDAFAGPGVQALLSWAVGSRLNVIVSGGTGTGKTTLLNALGGLVPATERIVTIEDTAELRLPTDHVVRLEARSGNAEGIGSVTVCDLVRHALRMRPDRIVVGEVRGDEVVDMLQAMNTGHDGSLCTIHANSATDALRRIDALVLAGSRGLPLSIVRELVASSIDLVVHVCRRPDGRRRIASVSQITEVGVASVPADAADPSGRTVLLADASGVVRLPTRSPRSVGAPAPSPAWLS